ncbi:phosphohistidine phosphatase SixA [Catenovulum sp. 2E275]|uniref:phosphohistidine phosphatase SixA n=1 Tax=Catenovulum sp. 2E275 TaxID=2980497 RepID=UPI0021D2A233|nr:phosphohistidine phosphatase SixA [Catenovulum sp. 2E275]MCU4674808.1 phosphohistidine phosphatase SixA [Catenovulum sp. 2E275]
MQLFIVRHGEAEFETKPDSSRQLNSNGQQECESTGHWIAEQCTDFDIALVSPFVRAQQTWNALQKQGVTSKQLVTLQELTPDSDAEKAACVIKAYSQGLNKVIVVSHLPLVCFLVDEFVTETCPLFATGSTALIEIDEEDIKGHLLTLVSPSELTDKPELRTRQCC